MLVYVTKDMFLFHKKVKVKNPIYINDLKDYRPLRDYTFVLLNDKIDDKIFELDNIIQVVSNCKRKHEKIIYLKNYTKEQIYHSLCKKIKKEEARKLLPLTNSEIENELYKYQHSQNYIYQEHYRNEEDFCNAILTKKEIKEIPNFNIFFLTYLLYQKGNDKVKELILDIEDKIKRGKTENDIRYLIIKVRSVL